ncbi:MAG: ABC-ATPase domain-containing protein, partial [Lachnospiraceae bacterium]|nr:ABC-ATPase domain-containing protein [Lachnospiraceae bacterium]
MNTSGDLRNLLNRIDHRGYPAYKDTKGRYQFSQYILSIDHVQGDPFASPSKVSIHVPGKTAGFDSYFYENKYKRIAFQDHLLRRMARLVREYSFQAKGSGKSGLLGISQPGQQVLNRSACVVNA